VGYDLACRLRLNGVDVIFDKFETRIGSDLPLFMDQGLSQSNRVICICSELYNQKANAGCSGVGYEKRIICEEIIKDSSTAWVVPLIRNNKTARKLPIFLSSLKYLSFEDDSKYSESFYDLLRELHDQTNLPPLGKSPFEHNEGIIGKIEEMNKVTSTLSFTNKFSGNERINYLSNSGVFTIGTDLYEFKMSWSDAGGNSIHAYKDGVKAIACTSESIDPKKVDLHKYDFSNRARTARIGETIIWVNKNGKILLTKIENIEYENNQKHWVSVSYRIIEDVT
jgi:hypothetical protein